MGALTKHGTGNRYIYKRFVKRPMEFLFATSALIILSPVMLIIALLVKVNLGSPVVFKQERPGLNEKIFMMYKFRTMTNDRDDNGDLLPDAKRTTKFGNFLRSTSMDELPGLWNVIRGDMAIVGPRPLLVRYLPYYTDEERTRHSVRPGITGLAQVNGRNLLSWDQRLEMDVWYAKNVSLQLDLKILALTIKNVVCRKGVVAPGEHVMASLDVERGSKSDGTGIQIERG
ncbi:MAG TPA: sugar transferase [Bacillota bacterium]|nr:sugar transferase [Bacillota bacterium]